ncbi:MAG: NifU family protein [Flavobacteriales bacterium]|nr:NifU family protein [Flavobacteriales bacterium]
MLNMTKVPTSLYSEATPNPRVIKFTANRILVDQNIYEFNNKAEAIASPLALELFSFPFVESVFISNNFISVTKKDNNIEWSDIVLEMREFIRDYLVDGGVVINENALTKKSISITQKEETKREFTSIEKKIADLLDEYVKPAVEQDGGFISLKNYDKGIVTVSLQGACSGCPSSTMTLKSGIEGLLKREMPNEIIEVIADND